MKFKYILFLLFLVNYISSQECPTIEVVKKTVCENINVGSNKKCYYIDSDCIEEGIFSDCSKYAPTSNFNNKICESITYRNNKCVGDGTTCTSRKKTCSEYNSKDQDVCSELDSGDSKNECTLINGKCQSILKCSKITVETDCDPDTTSGKCIWIESSGKCSDLNVCESYKGENSNICTSIDIGSSDKCIYSSTADNDGNKCHTPTTCEDYDTNCSSRSTTDDKKLCILSQTENKCIEQFKTCEIYNSLSSGKSGDICIAIKPLKLNPNNNNDFDTSSKCIWKKENDSDESESCLRVKKECSDIQDPNECFTYTPETQNAICIYDNNNGCKEVYTSCQLNTEGSACKAVQIYDSTKRVIDYSKYCEFTSPTCDQKTYSKCDDYNQEKTSDTSYCFNIKLNKNNRKCAFVNSECVEQPQTCDETETDREKCKEIILINDEDKYYECDMDKDKCKKKQKLCSEYEGNDEKECQKYAASDTNRYCAIVNEKCIEQYKYCSDYELTGVNSDNPESGIYSDDTLCKLIIPYDDNGNPLKTHKCVLSEVGCMREIKRCGDALSAEECEYMTPENIENKTCVYYNGLCSEQFKSCEKYYEETFSNVNCNNIHLPNYTTKKCIAEDNKCKTENIGCDDYDNAFINNCDNINAQLTTGTKCEFSGTTCTIKKKTCSELAETNEEITDDICKSATTSNDKECTLKSDKYGCVEISKGNSNTNTGGGEEESKPNNGENNGENNEENNEKNNSKFEVYLSKLLFITICLLY